MAGKIAKTGEGYSFLRGKGEVLCKKLPDVVSTAAAAAAAALMGSLWSLLLPPPMLPRLFLKPFEVGGEKEEEGEEEEEAGWRCYCRCYFAERCFTSLPGCRRSTADSGHVQS